MTGKKKNNKTAARKSAAAKKNSATTAKGKAAATSRHRKGINRGDDPNDDPTAAEELEQTKELFADTESEISSIASSNGDSMDPANAQIFNKILVAADMTPSGPTWKTEKNVRSNLTELRQLALSTGPGLASTEPTAHMAASQRMRRSALLTYTPQFMEANGSTGFGGRPKSAWLRRRTARPRWAPAAGPKIKSAMSNHTYLKPKWASTWSLTLLTGSWSRLSIQERRDDELVRGVCELSLKSSG
jgi:hypothetical protein